MQKNCTKLQLTYFGLAPSELTLRSSQSFIRPAMSDLEIVAAAGGVSEERRRE